MIRNKCTYAFEYFYRSYISHIYVYITYKMFISFRGLSCVEVLPGRASEVCTERLAAAAPELLVAELLGYTAGQRISMNRN